MQSAAVLLLLATGLALGGSAGASDFDAHLPDMLSRSWFQGWYLRLTTDEGGLGQVPASLALILGYVPRGRSGWNVSIASLVVQKDASPRTRPAVYETNAAQLAVTAGGGLVLRQPDPAAPANLTVASANGRFALRVHEGGCTAWADFEGGARLSLNCLGPPARPWGPGGEGPEGDYSRLPDKVLGLHWFVLSLGTAVEFTWMEAGGHTFNTTGQLHMETNWGEKFPPCWVWAQGSSPEAAFAFAGGNAPALPRLISPKVWLLGVHTEKNSWNMRPWSPTYFTVGRDPCAGTLTLRARQAWREVELEVAAPPGSFAALQCPTEEGFRPFSAESFSGRAEVRLFSRNWDLSRHLVESFSMENVGLEFGGDCRCGGGERGALFEQAA